MYYRWNTQSVHIYRTASCFTVANQPLIHCFPTPALCNKIHNFHIKFTKKLHGLFSILGIWVRLLLSTARQLQTSTTHQLNPSAHAATHTQKWNQGIPVISFSSDWFSKGGQLLRVCRKVFSKLNKQRMQDRIYTMCNISIIHVIIYQGCKRH